MDSVFLLIDIFILRIILLLMPKEGLILKKIMEFPHCPIRVVLAFVSVYMGVTRSYMFYTFFR